MWFRCAADHRHCQVILSCGHTVPFSPSTRYIPSLSHQQRRKNELAGNKGPANPSCEQSNISKPLRCVASSYPHRKMYLFLVMCRHHQPLITLLALLQSDLYFAELLRSTPMLWDSLYWPYFRPCHASCVEKACTINEPEPFER